MRIQLRALLLAPAVIVALALPAAAGAQNPVTNPLSLAPPSSPLPAQTPTATTQTAITASTSGGGGLGGGGIVAISIGAIVLLGGISFFIWRDARRRAPVRHRAATAGAGGGNVPGSKRVKPRKLSPAERRRRKRGRAR